MIQSDAKSMGSAATSTDLGGQTLTAEQIRQISPAALAFLGDALYDLHVRRQMVFPPLRLQAYHQQVVARVKATAQAQTLQALIAHLSPLEQEVVRWGRNGCGRPPRHLSSAEYQQASGFETLLGYLYLAQPQRLAEILALADALCQDPPLADLSSSF